VTSHLLESLEYSSISIRAKREKGCMDPEEAEMKKKNYCVRVDIAISLPCFDTQGVFLTPNSPAHQS
jgi:hypothetical protein